MINLLETLYTSEAKQKFRELVKKYHTDNINTGDEEKIRRINNAKDVGDKAIDRLYIELMGNKNKEQSNGREAWWQYEVSRNKQKEEKSQETIKQKKARLENWLKQPEFVKMFNEENVMYVLNISESNRVYITVKFLQKHHTVTLFVEDVDQYFNKDQAYFLKYLRWKIQTAKAKMDIV